jgi:dihydrofolate reductase
MRKTIAGINMTIDGYCDHTAVIPDEEIHQHYTDMLTNGGIALFGRITYQLMEFWQPFVTKPSGEKAMDNFALAIDSIPKLVFSTTLTHLNWQSARLAQHTIADEVANLKQQPGKDILVCSPSLIVAMTQLGLIDEYQLCIHPVIAGSGLPLFKNITDNIPLQLTKTKQFASGAMLLHYEPKK